MRKHVVDARPNWAHRMLARRKGRIFVCFYCWIFEGGGEVKPGEVMCSVVCYGCGRPMDDFRRTYAPRERSGKLFREDGK